MDGHSGMARTRPSRSVCPTIGTVSVSVKLSTVIRSSVPVPSNTELGTRYSVFITNNYHHDYAVLKNVSNARSRMAIVFFFVTNYFYCIKIYKTQLRERENGIYCISKRTIWMGSPSLHPRYNEYDKFVRWTS